MLNCLESALCFIWLCLSVCLSVCLPPPLSLSLSLLQSPLPVCLSLWSVSVELDTTSALSVKAVKQFI